MQQVTIMLMTPTRGPQRIKEAEYEYMLNCAGATIRGSGKEKDTTGNRVALVAMIAALRRIRKPVMITVMTDSWYLIRSQGALAMWKQSGWTRQNGKPLKNADLWEELFRLQKQHAIRYQYEDMDLYYEKRKIQKEINKNNDMG